MEAAFDECLLLIYFFFFFFFESIRLSPEGSLRL